MTAKDWTCPDKRARDARDGIGVTVSLRDHGYGAAVATAYRHGLSELPDDMLRLLAKLN